MANEVRVGTKNNLSEKIVDVLHDHCHFGKMNFVSVPFFTVANGGSANVLICTSTNDEVHFRYSIDTFCPSILKLYEGTVINSSNYGTVYSPINLNRNFTTSADTVMFAGSNSTGGSLGTLLFTHLMVGSTGGGVGVFDKSSVGSEASSNIEWILKKNTNYFLSIVNTSGIVGDYEFETDFYEVA